MNRKGVILDPNEDPHVYILINPSDIILIYNLICLFKDRQRIVSKTLSRDDPAYKIGQRNVRGAETGSYLVLFDESRRIGRSIGQLVRSQSGRPCFW